jgi:hypothetical protein
MKTMKKYIPLILAIPFLFSSCSDEEPSPEARITGIYEQNYEFSDTDWQTTIQFERKGTFYTERVVKNSGGDEIIGFYYYGSGTYTISEDDVAVLNFEEYYIGPEDGGPVAKSDLYEYEDGRGVMNYSILEDYTRLRYQCGPSEFCAPSQDDDFIRVD